MTLLINGEKKIAKVLYGNEYILPVYPNTKDYVFKGFENNGQIISVYKQEVAENVTLNACFERQYTMILFEDKEYKAYINDEIELEMSKNPFLRLKGYKVNGECYDGITYKVTSNEDLNLEPIYTLNPIMYIPISIIGVGIIGFVIWRKKR